MFVNPECFESIESIKDEARRRVREYSINVPEQCIERFVAEGDAAGHITQWASENDVDLIVRCTIFNKCWERLKGCDPAYCSPRSKVASGANRNPDCFMPSFCCSG
jgi:hypothetical protein